ncbi:unnamed protein product [Phytomonas sp. Hart1]|nr:unnamed protein product [Phytomonas sp. Hart1]|eukprot:CCW71886.1 unnamed protein product [Phytomonas sp. isolate Hart1]
MSSLIISQRYNWMGYNGTESKEIDQVFVRSGDGAGIFDYWRRRSVLNDIKKRLHLIKGELNLIPEDELRAEREAARRCREANEAARRAKLNDDANRSQEEEARRLAQVEFERRMRAIMQRTAGISEAECNELLENLPHSRAEMVNAVNSFSTAARGLLVAHEAHYISYLDGSCHTSLDGLDQYNVKIRNQTKQALEELGMSLPQAEVYSTGALHDAKSVLKTAQQKLQAFFCQRDRTHAMRLRRADKDARGVPTTALTEEDGDEETLRQNVDDALVNMVTLREAYNERSAAFGQRMAALTINSN